MPESQWTPWVAVGPHVVQAAWVVMEPTETGQTVKIRSQLAFIIIIIR